MILKANCYIKWINSTVDPTILDVSQGRNYFTLSIYVDSNTPINTFSSLFTSPSGQNIYGGGNSINGNKIGIQLIQQQFQVNSYIGNGTYTWSEIQLSNQADEYYKYIGNITAIVNGSKTTDSPILLSVQTDKEDIYSPDNIILQLQMQSQAPPYMLCLQIFDPDQQNLEGGCSDNFQFVQINDTIWNITTQRSFPLCCKPGVYNITQVSIINEGLLESQKWQNDISVNVNTSNCSAKGKYCNVVYSTAYPSVIYGNGSYNLTIYANSSSEVNWLDASYIAPDKNTIEGGGNEIKTQAKNVIINNNVDILYLYQRNLIITPWMPRGEYVWTQMSMKNQQGIKSSQFQTSVSVKTPKIPNANLQIIVDTSQADQNWQDQLVQDIQNSVNNIDNTDQASQYLEISTQNKRQLQVSTSNQQTINVYLGTNNNNTLIQLIQSNELIKNSKIITQVKVLSYDVTPTSPSYPNNSNVNKLSVCLITLIAMAILLF